MYIGILCFYRNTKKDIYTLLLFILLLDITNFNLYHILDPFMSNFTEISICPPPNYSKTMITCSKIKSLPPKGVYYSLFQSIDAATLTTDWEAKPDQSVVITDSTWNL